MRIKSCFLIPAITLATTAVTHAGIIASESFDYASGRLVDQTATGTGFTGNWTLTSGFSQGSDVYFNMTSGLMMENVYSSGNAVLFASGANQSRALTRTFDSPLSASNTLYGSYLFQYYANGSTGNTVGAIMVGNGSENNLDSSTFGWAADGYNNQNTVNGPTLYSEGSKTSTIPSMALAINTTYAMIFQFNAATMTTSSWVLNEAQMGDAIANGGLVAANLDARTGNSEAAGDIVWKGTLTSTGPMGDMTNLMLVALPGQNTSDLYEFTYDEIRFSDSSLSEAVTVPESSTVAMLLGGLFAVVHVVRRRRAS